MKSVAGSRAVRTVHRRLGITSAIFVIILSLTGTILHHSAALGIDGWFISSGLVQKLYGIEAPEQRVHFSIEGHGLTYIDDALYFDQERLPGRFTEPRGGIAFDQGLAVATASTIILLTPQGEVIEVITAEYGVPSNILKIGAGPDSSIYLQTTNGVLEANLETLRFSTAEFPSGDINWSAPVNIDKTLAAAIKQDYVGTLINWERLVLDIHSGRVLGTFGVIVVDLMAMIFIVMAVSGLWILRKPRA